jgi:choice-of-anchor A domain-containing protein
MGASQTLTLNGSGNFVFNISGQMQLDASSAIVLTGGATDANVLFNITGTTTAGQSGSSVIHGIILAPHADVVVDGGTGAPPRVGVFGEVISGADIDIHSGSGINSPSVPDAGSALALMGLGLGFLAGAKRKFRS